MTAIQKFFMKILPKHWAEDLRAKSEHWKIRCTSCGFSRSIWEAGGIRWKAASKGKRTFVLCPGCRQLTGAAIEYDPNPAAAPPEDQG